MLVCITLVTGIAGLVVEGGIACRAVLASRQAVFASHLVLPGPHFSTAAGGALDFVFVLQDKSDPAHAVISQLIQQQQRQQQQVRCIGGRQRAGIANCSADPPLSPTT